MIRKITTFILILFASFLSTANQVQAQINDGDWLLFDENQWHCFGPGECVFGYMGIFGNVENDSCTNLGYSINYILAFAGSTDTFLQKLNQTSTNIDFEVIEGQYDLYIHGINACGIEAFDTMHIEINACDPPFAIPIFPQAIPIDSNESITLFANNDLLDDFNGYDCLFNGFIDSLKVKFDDGDQINSNLLDSLTFTDQDTGYHNIQLWEYSWGEWRYSGNTWIHIYFPYDNSISGTVYYDQNENCHFDDGEPGIRNRTVYSGGLLYSDVTDSIGQYSLNYRVPTSPSHRENTGLWPIFATGCQTDTIFPNALLKEGSLNMDWGIQLKPDCSELQVDISAPFLRRCFNSNYYINYCNAGDQLADSAYIEIVFDPFLEVISSTIPWSNVDGQTYTFPIGDVNGGACGSFQVLVNVDCENTTIGQLHCSEAHIYPDETCVDTSGFWGGGNIEMRASCAPDSVRFTIKNTGLSPTTIPLEYFIVEDDIIIFFESFDPLNPGDSIKIGLPKTGSHYFAQSEQEPFHPFPSDPSAFIEGCASQSDSFSIGYAGQFPINDEEPFLDIDCIENIGSFDPNDKAAQPKGFSDQHFVEPGDHLEYTIRFQNTGTDTAFTVQIVDTLSGHLLYGTFNPLVASHDYLFEITPEGVVTFTFHQIALPDSNINEMASHGFIKFSIDLRKDLQAGTAIQNDASIYFDFNEPVITNLVNHMIRPDFAKSIFESTVVLEEPSPSYSYWSAEVSPNPVDALSTIQVNHPTFTPQVEINIFNSMGQHMSTTETNELGRANIRHSNLSPGVYYARVSYGDVWVTSARFVKI